MKLSSFKIVILCVAVHCHNTLSENTTRGPQCKYQKKEIEMDELKKFANQYIRNHAEHLREMMCYPGERENNNDMEMENEGIIIADKNEAVGFSPSVAISELKKTDRDLRKSEKKEEKLKTEEKIKKNQKKKFNDDQRYCVCNGTCGAVKCGNNPNGIGEGTEPLNLTFHIVINNNPTFSLCNVSRNGGESGLPECPERTYSGSKVNYKSVEDALRKKAKFIDPEVMHNATKSSKNLSLYIDKLLSKCSKSSLEDKLKSFKHLIKTDMDEIPTVHIYSPNRNPKTPSNPKFSEIDGLIDFLKNSEGNKGKKFHKSAQHDLIGSLNPFPAIDNLMPLNGFSPILSLLDAPLNMEQQINHSKDEDQYHNPIIKKSNKSYMNKKL